MTLFDKIVKLYPELLSQESAFLDRLIVLQNDSDGKGDYIREWNHPTLERPTEEQLSAIEE